MGTKSAEQNEKKISARDLSQLNRKKMQHTTNYIEERRTKSEQNLCACVHVMFTWCILFNLPCTHLSGLFPFVNTDQFRSKWLNFIDVHLQIKMQDILWMNEFEWNTIFLARKVLHIYSRR